MTSIGTSLGDLASTGAAARRVLLQHRLDFCCGGGRALEVACASAGLDATSVLREIEEASAGSTGERDWSSAPLADIVAHVLTRYHAPLPGLLTSVLTASRRVERVHREKAACPSGLADTLEVLSDELTTHMAKEEAVLFPAIVSGVRGGRLAMPIQVMLREHDEHGLNLKRLRSLTNDLTPPPEACGTWRTLYEELERLESELMAHIHLENQVLFPRTLSEG